MTDTLGGNAKEQLKSYIERVERLEEEKKSIADDVRDVYGESKRAGFDPKAIRAIVKRRKDPEKTAEHEALVESYLHAMGWADTPLGIVAGDKAKVVQ